MLFVSLAGTSSATAKDSNVKFSLNPGDYSCDAESRLASTSFVQRNRAALCNGLQDWDVARLSGQASLSGPAHNCEIRLNDTRRLLKSVCIPKADNASIRGILLFGGFRTQDELNAASPQDWRDALSTELSNRLAEPVATFEALSDDELSAIGGLFVFVRTADGIDALKLSKFTLDDLRREARKLLLDQTGIPLSELSGMTDTQLFDLFWNG